MGQFSILAFLTIKLYKMSNEKTLGGDRLGSGKKMKVHLKGYERSTHDLGYIWRSSMSAGTLVPFMNEVMLPGDTFDIELECDVKTLPTIGPLFGSYKVQLDVFSIPIRLYNRLLHNNQLNIGLNMSSVTLPVMRFSIDQIATNSLDDLDNAQINPSCLLAYLGIRGYGVPDGSVRNRDFNAVPLLGYWDIYKNYYANKQEQIGAVVHVDRSAIIKTITGIYFGVDQIVQQPALSGTNTIGYNTQINVYYTGATPNANNVLFYFQNYGWVSLKGLSVGGNVTDTGTQLQSNYNGVGNGWLQYWNYTNDGSMNTEQPQVKTFPLTMIDTMREDILKTNNSPFNVFNNGLYPYTYLWEKPNNIYNTLSSQEGLGLKTYQSDIFNNWLETTWINQISTTSAVSTVSGSFTIDQLILSRKVYEMLNRIAVSGGSYDDWIEAVYDHKPYNRATSPVYHGGLIKELVFQEVVSNTQTAEQPLGTLAGKGTMAKKHKGGKVLVKADEHSYVMGIVSLTPRIDYSQGNKWDMHLKTMDDFHKPQLDEIGFQDLITEQAAWWETHYVGGTWVQKSAGKQPAWLNYMTNYNRTFGNFAMKEKEMFMTLNRRYEYNQTTKDVKDMTSYIDPAKFNFIFSETQLDAQNFWVQIGVDITARRKMSAKVMPNL